MQALKLIKQRRSARKFKKDKISSSVIKRILEAGRWAPSGLNNQPWRFMVLHGEEKDELSRYTHYSSVIKSADKAIMVFLDREASYNYEKDVLAVGACVQNMLLYIESISLGACWLGEILNQRQDIKKKFNLPKKLELEAVIALGKPLKKSKKGERKLLKNLMVKRK